MKYLVSSADKKYVLNVQGDLCYLAPGEERTISLSEDGGATFRPRSFKLLAEGRSFLLDGKEVVRIGLLQDLPAGYRVRCAGQGNVTLRTFQGEEVRPIRIASQAKGPQKGTLASPLNGKVISIHAQPGVALAAGDLLFVIEAMKMENRIVAEKPLLIKRLVAAPGSLVRAGDPLLDWETPPA